MPGWYSMCKELPKNTAADSCLVPASENLLSLVKTLKKKLELLSIFIFAFLHIILWFIVEGLAWATSVDKLSPVKVLASTSLVVA